MEIWLDTINLELIKHAHALGILHGVTTNPSILSKADSSIEQLLEKILEIQSGPITLQVVADEVFDMVQQGKKWHSFSERILIKVPVTQIGLEAMHLLSREGIPTMATVVFHPSQALMAALAGAHYIAPYFGRMLDAGLDAFAHLKSMQNHLVQYQLKSKLLVASLRTKEQILTCADLGVGAITLKDALFLDFIQDNPLTLQCIKTFADDWKSKQMINAKMITK